MRLTTVSLYPHMTSPARMDGARRRQHALYMLADMVDPFYRAEARALRDQAAAGCRCPQCGEDMGPPGSQRRHTC